MIFVRREDPLPGFGDRAREWVRRYEEARVNDRRLTISKYWTRIRREMTNDVEHLFLVFHGKCAFCESHMSHVSYANIEHYRPKGKGEFYDLVFEWDNWLLVCTRCNGKKWRHFPFCGEDPCLINPTEEDPANHLYFVNSLVFARTQRGERTIDLIDLKRSPLEDERVKWLSYIRILLLLLYLTNGVESDVRNLIVWCMQDEAPYTAMNRAYLREYVPLLAAEVHPHVDIRDPITQIENLVEFYRDGIKGLL